MQDHAKQIDLLNRMRDEPDGSIGVRRFLGMSEDQRHELHQIELLCQMGLALMKSESMVRITADGYRHLGVPVGDFGKQSELLENTRDSPDGCLLFVLTLSMPPDERHKLHQIELLCDMGLTHMKSDSMACLTPAGYEHFDDESRGDVVRERTPTVVGLTKAKGREWDVFISHATEDKDRVVRPLAKELENRGITVWLDETELRVGVRLRRSIDRGLKHSRYGIVVLSPSFFGKHWPQQELDGLLAREADGRDLILPVWHNVDADEVRAYSPILADRVATSSSAGIEAVADDLLRAMGPRDGAAGDPDRDELAAPASKSTQPSGGERPGAAGKARSDRALMYKILEYVGRKHRGQPVIVKGAEFEGYDGAEAMRGITLCVANGYIIGKTEYADDEVVMVDGLTAKGRQALETML